MAGEVPIGVTAVSAQIALALLGIGAVAAAPPAAGAMLVVPYDGVRAAATIDASLSAGASLLGSGPVPGSVLVVADRARLTRAFADRHVLLLAAPASMCGS